MEKVPFESVLNVKYKIHFYTTLIQMPEFWAKLSIWSEHQELCLSKQLSLELEVLLTPMHYINIYFRKRRALFLCDLVLWYPQASLLQLFEKGPLVHSRHVMPGCYTPEQWAVKPRLWEEEKSWNYSGSRRKSEGSGILVREMRSLQLVTVIIRWHHQIWPLELILLMLFLERANLLWKPCSALYV